jgi:hypothetical protein
MKRKEEIGKRKEEREIRAGLKAERSKRTPALCPMPKSSIVKGFSCRN